MSMTKRFYENIAGIVKNEGIPTAVAYVIKKYNVGFTEAQDRVYEAMMYYRGE